MITQFFKHKTSDESSESGDINNNKASPTCDNLSEMGAGVSNSCWVH
jgi:hypothetical protein